MAQLLQDKRWSWIARGAVLGVIVAIVAVIVIDRLRQRTSPNAFKHAREAQTTASSFPAMTFAQAPDLERAVADLLAAETARRERDSQSPFARVQSDSWKGAVRVCVDFLRACSTGRADAFEEWARAQHKQLPPRLPDWGPYTNTYFADRYESVVGRSMSPGMTPSEFFRDYFEAYWSRAAGELRPHALVSDPQAIEVQSASFTHWGDYIGAGSRADGLGDFFWIGGITIGGVMLWWPERVLHQAPPFLTGQATPRRPSLLEVQKALFEPGIQAHGSIDAVRIRLVYRSAIGINVPVQFFLTCCADDGAWELVGLNLNNIGADVGIGAGDLQPPVY